VANFNDDSLIDGFAGYLRFERGYSENTVQAYISDLTKWFDFCARHAIDPFPPKHEFISKFLKELAEQGKAKSSLQRYAATIRSWNRYLSLDRLNYETYCKKDRYITAFVR